jgi:hypothetical protein
MKPGKSLIRSDRTAASVILVNVEAPALQSFLVEWYQPALTGRYVDEIAASLGSSADALLVEGHCVRLQLVVAATEDEVLYGLFEAKTSQAVAEACTRAGWRADRIIAGVQTFIP